MENVPEYKSSIVQVQAADLPPVLHATASRGEEGTNVAQKYKNLDMTAVVKACKGKSFFLETKESFPDVVSLKHNDSYDEVGNTSFSGASHPPEPVDVDLIRTFYVSIGGNRPDAGCLIKALSVNGPFIEDLSAWNPGIEPSASLSSMESLVEEARPSGTLLSPLSVDKASQSMDNTYLMQDSTEKECVWDAYLPASSNVSSLSSIGGTIVTTKSAIKSCRSDGVMSDGILSKEMNCESAKACAMGDLVESEKTSMSRASDSSGLSDDSNWSNITGTTNKPHKGNDPRRKAIIAVQSRDGLLGMSHFKLLKRLGCGDIGSVYLSELSWTRCYFAMKVMDKASLASRKKLTRAQTEREIPQLLDHPFLPTLYAHFETDRFSCLVMEFCPGGDLHTLRQRQSAKHFSEYAGRKGKGQDRCRLILQVISYFMVVFIFDCEV